MIVVTKLAEQDERLLRSICVHESGHAIVSAHFGMNPRCYIGGPRSGITRHEPGYGFQNACVAMGGIAAEDMLVGARHPLRTLPACFLSRETLLDWSFALDTQGALQEFRKISAPDVQMIETEAERLREIARATFAILHSNQTLLEQFAAELADDSRERFRKAQLRNDFEADEATCLRLVR